MRKCFIVSGLLFGDEGKGATTDYLVRKHDATLVVRYNGGPQNSHNVVTSDGRHHAFAQFGSGSFVPGVRTFISEHMLFDPLAMLREAAELHQLGIVDIFDRTTIDPEAVVITPFHIALNRIIEITRGAAAHGSCGVGLGVARADALAHPKLVLRARHLYDANETMKRLWIFKSVHKQQVQDMARDIISPMAGAVEWKVKEAMFAGQLFDGDDFYEYLLNEYSGFPKRSISLATGTANGILCQHDTVVFEGSQGILLDEDMDQFHPHVTWTDTTFENAFDLIFGTGTRSVEIVRIGCLRPYATRHGAGELPEECSELSARLPELHNQTGQFSGKFRTGWLNLDLLRFSIEHAGKVDQIAISCMDRLADLPNLQVVTKGSFRRLFVNPGHMDVQGMFVDWLQTALKIPVTILGYGPTAEDRQERLIQELKKAA